MNVGEEEEVNSCEVRNEVTLSAEIISIIFFILLLIKTVLFDVNITKYVLRYLKTYKTWMQAEIWILILTAIKVSILLPNYWIKNMNYIYWVFVMNTTTTFWLSHVLHQRNSVVLGRSVGISW